MRVLTYEFIVILSPLGFQMGVLNTALPDGAFCFVNEYRTLYDPIHMVSINICHQCVDWYTNSGFVFLYEESGHIPAEWNIVFPSRYIQSDKYCERYGCVRRIVYKTLCQCIARQEEQKDDAVVVFDERSNL